MNLGKDEGKERETVDEMLPFILTRHFWFRGSVKHIGVTKGVGVLLQVCSTLHPSQGEIGKKNRVLGTMIAKVLRDLSFSLNQSQKLV